MDQSFDHLIFIGRFQPFHIGHLHIIHSALKHSKKLIILIGSASQARTPKNPLTFSERHKLITQSLNPTLHSRIIFKPIHDHPYSDEKWIKEVYQSIADEIKPQQKIGIIGHDKDESTYYLKLFENFSFFPVNNLQNINATDIRESIFCEKKITEKTQKHLTQPVINWLNHFIATPIFKSLLIEFNFILEFKKDWANTPYPVNFVTADALITHHHKLLLITRKNTPGKGLLALPGGYVNTNETCLDAAIRETKEETQLILHKKDCTQSQVFDQPNRSLRGRVLSHVFCFQLNSTKTPDVLAKDDAISANWYKFEELDQSLFFEDHYFIIQTLLLNNP